MTKKHSKHCNVKWCWGLWLRPSHIRFGFWLLAAFWLLSTYSSDNELIQLTRRVPCASLYFLGLIDLSVRVRDINANFLHSLLKMSNSLLWLLTLSLIQLTKGWS